MKSLKGRTILIVDDEPLYREVLVDEFRMIDATVLEAENGVKALDIVRANNVDAIISDVRMPGGNGIELLENVKALSPRLPVVILMTGFSDVPLDDAYAKGAEAIFSKPVDLVELVATVCSVLNEKKSRKAERLGSLPDDFRVSLQMDSLETVLNTKIINIGRGGMFVALDGGLPKIGDRLAFQLKSSSTIFEGVGICRWSRGTNEGGLPRGVGIEFQGLSEEALGVLAAVVEKLSQRHFSPKK